MSFYSDFAHYYDQIFPCSQDTIDLFTQTFQSKGILLDIGCGAGGYALALAKLGYSVDGIDYDSSMIDIANKKIKDQTLSLSFKQGNMLDIDMLDVYDGIYCIGNTLVHLPSEQSVFEALGKFYDALKPGGSLIIQIVNYDRILDQNVENLPTLRADNLEFIRDYHFNGTKIEFLTTLKTNEGTNKNTVDLLPVRQNDLFKMMNQIGFYEVRSFGRFDLSPFEHDQSFMLVMKGSKR